MLKQGFSKKLVSLYWWSTNTTGKGIFFWDLRPLQLGWLCHTVCTWVPPWNRHVHPSWNIHFVIAKRELQTHIELVMCLADLEGLRHAELWGSLILQCRDIVSHCFPSVPQDSITKLRTIRNQIGNHHIDISSFETITLKIAIKNHQSDNHHQWRTKFTGTYRHILVWTKSEMVYLGMTSCFGFGGRGTKNSIIWPKQVGHRVWLEVFYHQEIHNGKLYPVTIPHPLLWAGAWGQNPSWIISVPIQRSSGLPIGVEGKHVWRSDSKAVGQIESCNRFQLVVLPRCIQVKAKFDMFVFDDGDSVTLVSSSRHDLLMGWSYEKIM